MPEGPEVRRNATWLREFLGEQVVEAKTVSGKLHRVGIPGLENLNGRSITDVQVKGKVTYLRFASDLVGRSSLGMSGWWYPRVFLERLLQTEHQRYAEACLKHVRFALRFKHDELVYVDPRNFGNFKVLTVDEAIADADKLGVDVMTADIGLLTTTLFDICQADTRGKLLINEIVDQQKLAGIGNIYRSEAFHLACIHPFQVARDLKTNQRVNLSQAIRYVCWAGFYQVPVPERVLEGFKAAALRKDLFVFDLPQEILHLQTCPSSNHPYQVYGREGCQVAGIKGRTVWADSARLLP